jgi:hypothetical protein
MVEMEWEPFKRWVRGAKGGERFEVFLEEKQDWERQGVERECAFQ